MYKHTLILKYFKLWKWKYSKSYDESSGLDESSRLDESIPKFQKGRPKPLFLIFRQIVCLINIQDKNVAIEGKVKL